MWDGAFPIYDERAPRMQRVLFLSFSGLPGGLMLVISLKLCPCKHCGLSRAISSSRGVCDSAGVSSLSGASSPVRRVRSFHTTNFEVSGISLPTILLLFKLNDYLVGAIALLNSLSGISSVFSCSVGGQCSCHNFSIGGTYIGQVNCLTALLQLACEHRNRNSSKHGRARCHRDSSVHQSA